MKLITTQQELDALREIKAGEEVEIKAESTLRLNFNISIFGKLKISTKIDCSFYGNYFVAWENSSVVAWGNSSVEAWGNSSVVARGNSSVVARGNSSVVAWGNSSVEAWGNSSVKLTVDYSLSVKVKLFGFTVCWKPKGKKIDIEVKSKTAFIQEFEPLPYLEREGIEVIEKKVILFKRVSSSLKTQENTKNETLWAIGSTVDHNAWNPTKEECGEGKFHACSRPYFCDEFRSNKGDNYIAIEVHVDDLHEWTESPTYIHKIAFRACRVIGEVNRFGKPINN